MLSAQRVIGVLIIILALGIGIVPSFYNCAHNGIYMYVTGMDAMNGAKDDGKTISPDEMMTGTTTAGGTTATTMAGMGATTTTMGGMSTSTTGSMGASTGTTMAGGAASGAGMAAMSRGMKVPMKCFYSAKAAIGFAIPIGILGLLLLFSRRRETNRMLAIMGIVLGAVTVAVPTLVGTCGSASAICNEVLKPTVEFAGGLLIVLSVILLVMGERRRESTV